MAKYLSTQVNSLVNVIEDMRSPFEEESQELLQLHSKGLDSHCPLTLHKTGQYQYKKFVDEHIKANRSIKPIPTTILSNKVALFSEIDLPQQTKKEALTSESLKLSLHAPSDVIRKLHAKQ